MKKIGLIITLIAGLVTTSSADRSDSNTATPNILKRLLKNEGKTAWTKKDLCNETSFKYKGHEIIAYYNTECWPVGFSRRFNANDLPQEILSCIKKRHSHYVISDVIIFFDSNGSIEYYAGIKKSRRYMALKISSECRLSVIKKISVN